MRRIQNSTLSQWFFRKNRKPLLIRGARQVGKSTLVRIFGQEQGLRLVEINLEKHRPLDKIFSTYSIPDVIREIEGVAGQKVVPGETLLFLDEIQAAPEAIACLRYFYEELPQLAVIAAGSLLEFTLSKHAFSMPVGRIEYLHLGPMTFLEFLSATDEALYEIASRLSAAEPIAAATHEKLLAVLRDYLVIGGLPEAVAAFQERDYAAVALVHRSICETYQDDFAKYASAGELARLQRLFRALPGFIGRKIIYSRILEDEPAVKIKADLILLQKAKIVDFIVHTDGGGIPLGAGARHQVFKIVFLDVGLAVHLLGLSASDVRSLSELRLVNEGALAEQFAAQQFRAELGGRQLYYWQREGRSENAEVDFLLQEDAQIIPVEIKAGKSGTLKSLHRFMHEKRGGRAIRYDLNLPSTQQIEVRISPEELVRYQLESRPLYMAGEPWPSIDPLLHPKQSASYPASSTPRTSENGFGKELLPRE